MASFINSTAFPISSKNNFTAAKGKNSSKAINLTKRHRRISDPVNRLERAQKCLTRGQLTMIDDGLYETEQCKGCNKQHRVGNIDIRQCSCRNRHWAGGNPSICNNHKQSCTLPSILSKPSTTSSSDSVSMIKIASQVSSSIKDPIKVTIPFSREFCREMLNKEEIILNERLLFERKLLEESQRKHQSLEQEEAQYIIEEQKELEMEKEKFEHARKRTLALETILKTLNDIPEANVGGTIAATNSSRQKFHERQSQESCSSGGILRYNYSTASRKAVRIKGSSNDTTTESNNSSLSKYLTFASSQYLTTSSCSYNTDESSSNESVILVSGSLKDGKELSTMTTGDVESSSVIPTGNVFSFEKRLKPTDDFMLNETYGREVGDQSSPPLQSTPLKDNVTSAPVLIGCSVTTKVISNKITTPNGVDKAKSASVNRGRKKDVPPSSVKRTNQADKAVDETTDKKNIELTIPNLVITVPSRRSFTQDTTAFNDPMTSNTTNDGSAAIEANGSLPYNAPSVEGVTNPLATSSSAAKEDITTATTTSRRVSSHFDRRQPSNNVMIARSIVRKALEAVIIEYDDVFTMDSSALESPPVMSSEECLTQTATTLVRNAIFKVQKDLLKPLDNTRATKSSVSFNFLRNLQPTKSLKKIFSF